MGTTLPALAPPLTSRQAWTRLALLAATLAMALDALVLSLAWLWPQAPSRIIEVPLDTLEVGVPQFIRPFDMGGTKGHPYGIWLVRSDGNAVTAFWSTVPHPNACGVEVAEVVPPTRQSTGCDRSHRPPLLLRFVPPTALQRERRLSP